MAAFAAIPVVLTHECVCHVPARQWPPSNESYFAEGFMDWAALYYGQLWAGALPAAVHAHPLSAPWAGVGSPPFE